MASKLAFSLLLCMVLVAPYAEGAVTCGLVASKVAGCLGYLVGGPGPSAVCCAGIKQLNSAASSTADRKQACICLKAAAGAIRNLNYGKAAGLPGKCGVSIPYAISPSTNCNAIH